MIALFSLSGSISLGTRQGPMKFLLSSSTVVFIILTIVNSFHSSQTGLTDRYSCQSVPCCPFSSILSLIGVPVSGPGSAVLQRGTGEDLQHSDQRRETRCRDQLRMHSHDPIIVEDITFTTSFGVIALGRDGKGTFSRTMYIVLTFYYSVTCFRFILVLNLVRYF